jgi:hypothetical protein
MESKIATANDVLLRALSQDLPDSAEYVLSKEQVTYYPQGAQTYSPTAGRLIRFALGDGSGAMLDPTSVRLSYLLVNKADQVAANANWSPANTVQLLGPQSIFSRLRTLVNGSLAEDCLQYNQTVSLMDRLQPSARRYTDLLENNWVEPLYPSTVAAADKNLDSRRFVHPIMSGLFAQSRMIYLKVAPLTIELELVGDADEACAGPNGHKWEVTDIRLLANIVYLTPEFLDQITSSLLRGIALPIAYQTFAVQRVSYTLGGGNSFSVQLNRSLTRISKMFWTFTALRKDVDADAAAPDTSAIPVPFAGQYLLDHGKYQNSVRVGGPPVTITFKESELWKEVNCFAHPCNGKLNAATDTMEWSVLFGSKQLPVIPVRSVAESAWYLRAALGQSWYGSHDILLRDYCNVSAIFCISFERTVNCAGEGTEAFGGLSSVQGAQITLNVRNMPPRADDDPVFERLTMYLYHDAIASIRAEATEILL